MSRNHLEDYFFFLKNQDRFNFTDRLVKKPEYRQGSLTAREAFLRYLVNKRPPKYSCEPEELHALLVCRVTMLDFIKNSAAHGDYKDMPVAYFLSNFKDPPRWVLSMFIRESQLAEKNFRTGA